MYSLQYKDKVGRPKELPSIINDIKILGFAKQVNYNLYVAAICPECKEDWVTHIQRLRSEGYLLNEIATMYDTNRDLISRVLRR